MRDRERKAGLDSYIYTVSRISLTRPQLAGQVEELLVRMGQSGQIRGQVSDEALKGLLEQVKLGSLRARVAN